MHSAAERPHSAADSPPLSPAVERLREGGLVAYPTETVWGLAALSTSCAAVGGLIEWKGRGPEQPLSLLVADSASLEALGVAPTAPARKLAQGFWPGPLTLVVPGPPGVRFAPGIARRDGAVGFRCSPHPVAAALARAVERAGLPPVTATSLNRSGEAPARTRRDAAALCDGESCASGSPWLAPGEAWADPPSTVVELIGDRPRVLRWGAIDRASFEAWMGPRDGPEESE